MWSRAASPAFACALIVAAWATPSHASKPTPHDGSAGHATKPGHAAGKADANEHGDGRAHAKKSKKPSHDAEATAIETRLFGGDVMSAEQRAKVEAAIEAARREIDPPRSAATSTGATPTPAAARRAAPPAPRTIAPWLPSSLEPGSGKTPRERAHAMLNDDLRGRSAPRSSPPSADREPLDALLAGNQRFQRSLKPGAPPSPRAAVLSCTDAQIPPERLFDEPVATVSSVGEVPDVTAVAAIEHAVRGLGVRLVVVLGHDDCDVVARAVDGRLGGSPALDALVEEMGPRLSVLAGLTETPAVRRARVEVHATTAARRLVASSAVLRAGIASGTVQVVPMIYAPRDGALTVLELPKVGAGDAITPTR